MTRTAPASSAPSELLDRTPPHDLKAEQGVLGSIMLKSDVLDEVVSIVQEADFYSSSHRALYAHLVGLHYSGWTGDATMLADWLRNSEDAEAIRAGSSIEHTIVTLCRSVGSPAFATKYAKIVARESRKRRLISAHAEALRATWEPGADVGELASGFRATLDSITTTDESGRIQWLTSDELDKGDFKIEYLIDGVLARHQPCVVAGPSKALKTSLVIDLAVSLVAGVPFLGKFTVPAKRRVGVVTGESGMASIQNCVRRVIASKFVFDPSAFDGLFWSEDVPNFSNGLDLQCIRQSIQKHSLDVLIIDPLYQALPQADAASILKMGELLRAANDVCRATGCTLVLIHHTVKRPGYGTARLPGDPLQREDIHGAGIGEWMRQWVLLNRREDWEPHTPHLLNLVVGGSAGHAGRWCLDVDEGEFSIGRFGGLEKWAVTVDDPGESRSKADDLAQEARRQSTQERVEEDSRSILAIAAKHPAGETKRYYRDATRGGKRFDDAWSSLVESGGLIPSTIIKGNKQSIQAWKIDDNQEQW